MLPQSKNQEEDKVCDDCGAVSVASRRRETVGLTEEGVEDGEAAQDTQLFLIGFSRVYEAKEIRDQVFSEVQFEAHIRQSR